MEPLEIGKRLQAKFPDEVKELKEFGGQVSAVIKKDALLAILTFLKNDPDIHMDYLRDLCGVDYLGKKTPRFEVVYHLYSIKFRHMIRLKAEVPEEEPSIDSCEPLYRGANWHERECFDMFGITFNGHPDLRRILLPEDWEGHPLRKDYPLKGPEGEGEWKRFSDLVQRSGEMNKHGWYRDTSES